MDFVFCMDKNYVKGYGVLMLSILRQAPKAEPLCFHVLSDDIDDAGKDALKGIAAGREGAEVAFYSPMQALSEDARALISSTISSHTYIRAAAYYRFLAADLLPPGVKRALYLDGDMLYVGGGLDELFGMDLKGCPAAACFPPALPAAYMYHYNRLGYPPSEGYFNSGLILFDLDIWRKEGIRRAMFEWLAANAEKRVLHHDQDVLNGVLHGRIFKLNPAYNLEPGCFNVFYWLLEEKENYYSNITQYLTRDEWPMLREACENPRVLHFLGRVKPWFKECDHPFAPAWRYFYAQSPWKGEPLMHYRSNLPRKTRIKQAARRALARLNLMAPAGVPCPPEMSTIARQTLDRLMAEDRG